MNMKEPKIMKDNTSDKILLPKNGGHAIRLRKCHWCSKMIRDFACEDCKRKHGWSFGGCDPRSNHLARKKSEDADD